MERYVLPNEDFRYEIPEEDTFELPEERREHKNSTPLPYQSLRGKLILSNEYNNAEITLEESVGSGSFGTALRGNMVFSSQIGWSSMRVVVKILENENFNSIHIWKLIVDFSCT